MSSTMPALIRASGSVAVQERPLPTVAGEEVLVRVRAAGVCRTDVQVARGQLACADPLVLGHEFAGEVVELGLGATRGLLGAHVSAIPWRGRDWLGIDLDGAFAGYVAVHETQLVRLPESLPWRVGAYLEPVAAALGAVLEPAPSGRALVLGSGRIAQLTGRVLQLCARCSVEVAEELPQGSDNHWDVVIETRPTPNILARAIQAVRSGGRIVLKSRGNVTLELPLAAAISKGASIHPVGHGCFQRAAKLLSSEALSVGDLLGPTLPLSSWQQAFELGESSKVFLEA